MTKKDTTIERPPVVAILGHVDHGKSTLLDYLRQTNIVEGEAGGITQHVAAYQVTHSSKEYTNKLITFIDTPGHEAFRGSRERGAGIADIAILIISAEEGVKKQTIESLGLIQASGIPYIVAINKIDRPNANPDRAKQQLAERNVFLESWGGDVPNVAISAKTGTGIEELLDTILLVAELEELESNPEEPAHGFVLEAHVDRRTGITATVIIKDGTLETGMFCAIGGSVSKIKRLEDTLGDVIGKAGPSAPARIVCLTGEPETGGVFRTFTDKKTAESHAAKERAEKKKAPAAITADEEEDVGVLPLIVRSDVQGTLEAIIGELKSLETDRVRVKILASGVGDINEGDIKLARSAPGAIIIGFNVKMDKIAKELALSADIEPHLFEVIYKIKEFLEPEVERRRPRREVDEETGRARIIRIFSENKNKHVIGAAALSGVMEVGNRVKIVRTDHEIGKGTIKELQVQKIKMERIEPPAQFGALLESRTGLALGDELVAFHVVEK